MSKIKRQVSVSISPSTIFWLVFTYLAFQFVASITSILFLIFIALLISIAIGPLVSWLEKKSIPRAVSSLVILLLIFAGIVSVPISIIVPMADQTTFFLNKLPELFQKVVPASFNFDINTFIPQLSSFPNQVFKIASSTFSSVLTIFALIVISYYLIQERSKWQNYFNYLFPSKGDRYYHIASEIETKLGLWVRGEMILMLVVGVLSYLGYLAIGIPFAVPLALIAGLLEVVPNIGPTIAAFPAAIVGFSISPTHGFATIIISILVQQLENNLLVPKIMQSAVGVNPVISILTIMIGLHLGGPLLAILALPLVLVIQIILSHIRINQTDQLPEID
jgi:predicted PurR-regulated permease PerM